MSLAGQKRGHATTPGRTDMPFVVSISVTPAFSFATQLFNCDTQRSRGHLCASICYLESNTGSVLDLKWHFLPLQGDLSGVERSCGEWKSRTGEWMNEWIGSMAASLWCRGHKAHVLAVCPVSYSGWMNEWKLTGVCFVVPDEPFGQKPDNQSWKQNFTSVQDKSG